MALEHEQGRFCVNEHSDKRMRAPSTFDIAGLEHPPVCAVVSTMIYDDRTFGLTCRVHGCRRFIRRGGYHPPTIGLCFVIGDDWREL
jgi:hypothetical protein